MSERARFWEDNLQIFCTFKVHNFVFFCMDFQCLYTAVISETGIQAWEWYGKDRTFGAIGLSVLLDPECEANLSNREVLWTYTGSNGKPVNILDYVPNYTKAEPNERFRSRLHFNTSNGSLILENLKSSDQGIFAIFVDGQKKWTTDLQVIEPLSKPLIFSNSSFVDTTIELTCQVLRGNATSILWWKDGTLLPDNQHFLLLQNNSRLIISAAKKSDCGIYTCAVENPVSKKNNTYLLPVYGLSQWHYCTLGLSIATLINLAVVSLIHKITLCVQQAKIPYERGERNDGKTGTNVGLKLPECVEKFLQLLLKLSFLLLLAAFVFWMYIEGFAVITVITVVFLTLFLIPTAIWSRNNQNNSAVFSLFLSAFDLYGDVLIVCLPGILIKETLVRSGKGCEPAPSLQTSLILALVVPFIFLLISLCLVYCKENRS
ncbi:vascular endothelial growth factor receptor 2-like [Stegostoma tigrinum]|uniref:vascular endothelial growth factor receptor 2-like n=1 Tax=Stegostoma tigrinum TaxID=3053191 RepID=UPI002870ACDC|nr:vascular endothelial growth factor receptor 2-like [Stegostoma tigrinum]